MGEVVRLFDGDALDALDQLRGMMESGEIVSFVVCASLKGNAVVSAIHKPDADLYTMIGLMDAVKHELVQLHETRS